MWVKVLRPVTNLSRRSTVPLMSDWIRLTDGDTTWDFDAAFLESNWTCIWDAGCAGIADVAAPEAQLGCCSVGAEMLDDEEAMKIAALAATLDAAAAQFANEIADSGALRAVDSSRATWATRVVDGACIFLNRPGFSGGSGCALHIAAVANEESNVDWKPSICWQLPIKVEASISADGLQERKLRGWLRSDWGPEGESMAWCCTEKASASSADAFVADRPVIESLSEELTELLGPQLMAKVTTEIERRSRRD